MKPRLTLLLVAASVAACTDAQTTSTAVSASIPDLNGSFNQEVDYLKSHGCGEMVPFAPRPGGPPVKVFQLLDPETGERLTWHHDLNDCLDVLLNVVSQDPTNDKLLQLMWFQTLYELTLPDGRVRFHTFPSLEPSLQLADVSDANGTLDTTRFDRIAYTNDAGLPYEGQVQIDLGKWLVQVHALLVKKGADAPRRDAYLALGNATMGVITDKVEQGGLRQRKTCDLKAAKCSWFFAVTSTDRDRTEAGATLNKNLQVIRDLGDASDIVATTDTARSSAWRDAAVEGLNQLVYSAGSNGVYVAPNLRDFIALDPNGQAHTNSWALYSYNPENQKGYFLHGTDGEHEYKNCGYHLRNLTLLESIFRGMDAREVVVDRTGFVTTDAALGDRSILQFLTAVYRAKKATRQHLFDGDSATFTGGDFSSCDRDETDPLEDATLDYLEHLSPGIPTIVDPRAPMRPQIATVR